MNYCIHLKKRKNKPYCKFLNKEITFSLCRECVNKEYKTKIKENSFHKSNMSAETLQSLHNLQNSKSSRISKNVVLQEKKSSKKSKIHRKSRKMIVAKDTYNYVIERDNYSCRLCGSTSFLQLHHILYRSQRKDLINDVDNCIMLCSDCHRLVHSNKKKWQPILLKTGNQNKKVDFSNI